MNADDVARARYSIKLRDGREIQLVATYQRATYAVCSKDIRPKR